ncbi:hypothetical protein AB0C12_26250 [Actinoplanes sp. NPDC048967]|uniref:hypothetical protein n=1 Tax=Actinoplanes sp. NPDC048967 TaxID=3155269 RepID=UPI0033EEC017
MMLEDDLRAMLRERADAPVPAPDLLEAVRGGIRRSGRRRRAVLVAAAVLATAVAVPVAISGDRPPAPVPQEPAPADPVAGWQRPRLDLPVFPLTPGWTPPGAGTARVGRVGPNVLLIYGDSADRSMELSVGPKPADWWVEGEDRATTVHGRPALIRTLDADVYQGNRPGDRYVGVRWQLADGRWAQLGSGSRNTEAEVLRFADGLRPVAMPPTPLPFGIATAPPGLVLQTLTTDYLCLAPPATLTDGESGRGICLGLGTVSGQDEPSPEDERLTIGGRPATLESSDQGPGTLNVRLDAKRLLSIAVEQADVPLTRDQLIRFAEDITVPE